MRSNSAQTRIDRNAYIPPHVQQAMTQHMQHNMPAHLKKYVGSNAAYVPQHMQGAIAQHMQKNMPAHMKQYAGAYMQQQVVQPNTTRLRGSPPPTPHAPTNQALPDPLRRGHSMPYGEQHTVELDTLPRSNALFHADANQPSAAPAQPQQPQHVTTEQAFDFIMNPDQAPKKSSLPGKNSSLLVRIGLVAGGLLILMIVFSVVKGLLGADSTLPTYVTVAKDQQQLIHLASNAAEQKELSTNNQNFAATADASLSSAQTDLLKYLAANGKKIDAKQLNLGVSKAIDQRLDTAVAATTYNQTFQEIMQAKLTDYMSHLQQGFNLTKNPQGKALLRDDYKEAQLLAEQLKSGGSSSAGF